MPAMLNAQVTPGSKELGHVHFLNSCNSGDQEYLNSGVAALYSFWFSVAHDLFKRAEARDPDCMIAYWGEAMSDYVQIEAGGLPEGHELASGLQAIARGRRASQTSTREKSYLKAVAIIFDKAGTPDHDERVRNYSAAMGKIFSAYPWDNQAAVIYAMSLLKDGMPNDPDMVLARKSLAILDKVRAAEPDNPGVIHFIIHATDNPRMAANGLTAAREYAKIAPAVPHALHMPGHIFARLGLWREDIAANLASAAAARPLVHGDGQDLIHALEFLQYAYLQLGRDAEAEVAAHEAAAVRSSDYAPDVRRYYAFMEAGFPVRQAIETQNWPQALALRAPDGADADTRRVFDWAHAVAAGHLGDRAAAQQALASFRASYNATDLAFAHAHPSASFAETQAWTMSTEGNINPAARLLTPVADQQDRVGKGDVELPAREMLGNMFEIAGDYRSAEREYRASLCADPGRLNTLLRAGMIAHKLRQDQEECAYLSRLAANASHPSQRMASLLAPALTLYRRQCGAPGRRRRICLSPTSR